MCGRVIQSSGPLRLAIVEGLDVSDSRLGNVPRRYNAAPSQELLVIRQNHKTGERSLDLLKWGLIPHGASTHEVVAGRSMPKLRVFQGSRRSGMPMPCGAALFLWMASSSGEPSEGRVESSPMPSR